MFSRWAGVSPHRLQQYLTLGHAKALLDARATTLETAHEAGLSGAGRLHDLFVRWEAMTPGEWAAGGDATVRHARADSPFGEALVAATARGVCGIAFVAEIGREAAMADMAARWPGARLVEDPGAIAPLARAAFGGEGVALAPVGAPFAIKVWEALMRVPSGHVTTYSDVARAAGRPPRGARGGQRGGAQPGVLADPVPPRDPPLGGARRLPLGPAGQACHAGLRGRAPRRGGGGLRAVMR